MKRTRRDRTTPMLLLITGALLISLPSSQPLSVKGDIQVEVKVPMEAEVGFSADLECEWNITGGKGLYSVKWYKDEHEFFRYVPDNKPRMQAFPQPGVNLDKSRNSENNIRLTNLTVVSSGQYKCEVSTEAPSFETTYQAANLTVIALPERGPEITGLSSQYAVGENVTANCTAWPSAPRANISWTINGEEVPWENTIIYPVLPPQSSAGVASTLGLRVKADARLFEGVGGSVTVRCLADVGSRRYKAEKQVLKALVNNLPLSADGTLRGSGVSRKPSLTWTLVAVSAAFAAKTSVLAT